MATNPSGPGELRGLALRTLFPGFDGTDGPPPHLADLIEDGLGGVVLFGRNVDPVRGDAGVTALVARLHALRPDLIVGIDEEGGDVTRLDVNTGSAYPGSAALGSIDDPALTHDVAASLATRLRSCGFDLNFAPVADVDVDSSSPVVGVRSFGSDPQLVARHVLAAITGQQSRGLAAGVKHFPGHGDTSEDSHVTTPIVGAPRALLERRELVPFRAALAAGVKVVMTAHIRVSALDPDKPATMSTAVISGLLRDELGFDGVVMTDGLDMHAISRTVGHAEGGVRALIAGVDALCVGGDSTDPSLVEEMAAAIVTAVQSGRLPYERLAEAAQRVRALARWRTLPVLPDGDAADEPAEVRAARRALVVRGYVTLPSAPVVLELQGEPSLAAGEVPWGMGAPLAELLPGTVVFEVHQNGTSPQSLLEAHPGRPVVVSVRGVRRRPWQLDVVRAVRALRPDAIVVDHDLSDPAELGEPYVLAHGAARVTAQAVAELLSPLAAGRPIAGRSA
jgi:beta-N-acetylhexosaminidase